MIDSSLPLEGVEKSVRKFLVLRDDDPIIRVMIAAVLANFAPDRRSPLWLVIVGDPVTGREDLPRLFSGWSRSREVEDVDELVDEREPERRLIRMREILSVEPRHRDYAAPFRQRLVRVYEERDFGLVTSAGEEFYDWKANHPEIAGRFLTYWLDPFVDYPDAATCERIDNARAERAHWFPHAQSAVQAFADRALQEIDRAAAIKLTQEQNARLAAAVAFTAAVLETIPEKIGRDLLPSAKRIARMLALITGSSSVGENDMRATIDFITHQIPPLERRVIRYALAQHGAYWRQRACWTAVRTIRKRAEPIVEQLADIGLLDAKRVVGEGSRQHGFKYRASDRLRAERDRMQ